MGKPVKIEIAGIEEVKEYIQKSSKKATKQMEEGLSKAAIHVHAEVKQSIAGQRNEKTSVDTGRFQNSVGIKKLNNDAQIYTDLSYAKFLEFGTSKMKARKHFQNTKNRNKEKVIDIMKKAIKDI